MSSASKEDNLHIYEDLGRSPRDRSHLHISSRRVPTNSQSESDLALSPDNESLSCSHTPSSSSAHPVVKGFSEVSTEQETDADVLEVLAPDDLYLGEVQDSHRPTFPIVPGFMDLLTADSMECSENMNFECMFHLPSKTQSEDRTSKTLSRLHEKCTINASLGQESSRQPISNGQFKQWETGLGGAHDGIQVIEEFRPKDNRNNETIERPNEGTQGDQNGSSAFVFQNQSSVHADNNLKTSTQSATSLPQPSASSSTDRDIKMDDIQRSLQSQESTGTREPNDTDRRKSGGTSSCNNHYPEESQVKRPAALTERKCKDLEAPCEHEALIAELNSIKVNGIPEQLEEELMQRHPLSSGWISPSGLTDITTEDVEELRRANYAMYKLYQHMTDDQHHQEVALSAMIACLMQSSHQQITSERHDACKLQAASIHKIAKRRTALVKLHFDSRSKQKTEAGAEVKKPELWSSESQRFPRTSSSFRGRFMRSGRGFHEQTRALHHDFQGNGNYHDIRGRAPESNPPRGRFEGHGGRGSRYWVEYSGQRNAPYLINRRSIQR